MELTEKLLELGFIFDKNYRGMGHEAYVFRTSRGDKNRFVHDFVYYSDINKFYINAHKTSTRTITEREVLNDHNELNTPAKLNWLEIKDGLKYFEFGVYRSDADE